MGIFQPSKIPHVQLWIFLLNIWSDNFLFIFKWQNWSKVKNVVMIVLINQFGISSYSHFYLRWIFRKLKFSSFWGYPHKNYLWPPWKEPVHFVLHLGIQFMIEKSVQLMIAFLSCDDLLLTVTFTGESLVSIRPKTKDFRDL